MLVDYVDDGFVDLPSGEITLACRPHWEASSFAAQDHDAWTAFARSTCPIRILRAENESTCAPREGTGDLTADGRISIETIPGTSHFLPMERQSLCRAVLMGAIAGR
jgi:hypothetical protein